MKASDITTGDINQVFEKERYPDVENRVSRQKLGIAIAGVDRECHRPLVWAGIKHVMRRDV